MAKKKATTKVTRTAAKKKARVAKKAIAPKSKAVRPARKKTAARSATSKTGTKDTDPALASGVKELAYQFYLDRIEKQLPGDMLADWLAAERALSRA